MGQMPLLRRFATALIAAGVGVLGTGLPARAGTADVDDPVFVQGLQWGLEEINAPEAWGAGTGEGVTIAVVDSGVDLGHEDLRDKIVAEVSCVGAKGDPAQCRGSAQDDHGHGTHVAGIALASTDNGRGVAGVAPDADLMAVRVLTNQCDADGASCEASGTSADVSAGIRWAADHGADVINLSLGGGALQSTLGCSFCDAIEYAWDQGSIPVVAAGNDSVLPAGFSDEPAVIVSATTREDTRASYSSASSGFLRSARWPVAAPGGEAETDPSDCATGGTPKGVLSTYWVAGLDDQYACLAGTSMAAPHVSGALAVLLSTGITAQQAVDRLLASADDLGAPGRDDVYGVGRIDLAAAAGPGAPTRTTSTTATGSTGGSPTPSTAPPTTAITTPGATTTLPVVIPPGLTEAAPFTNATGAAEELPTWLVATAVLALLAAAGSTAAVAWHLAEREARG